MNTVTFDVAAKDRIIEMAGEDRTPFDAITFQFGLKEQDVIALMRREMKASSFKLWRKRVQGRATKHSKMQEQSVGRFIVADKEPSALIRFLKEINS